MLGFLYLSLPFLIPIVVFFSLCIIGAIGVAVVMWLIGFLAKRYLPYGMV